VSDPQPSERSAASDPQTAESSGLTLSAYLRLMRPRQWSKNLLVFAALVFSSELFSTTSLSRSVLAFVAFCLASSSVYVVNDLLDAERDRAHPEKRRRPIAAGVVSRGAAASLAVVLTVAGLSLAVWIRWPFALAIVSYILLVHFYSLVGKHIVILDTMLVAAGFVVRAVGGALAIDVPTSDWFVLCTFFAALFLALSKRRAERLALQNSAGQHRSVLDQYTESTLTVFTSTAIAATAISYALYALDTAEQFPLLPLTVPFVLFAIFRYHHLVETAGMGEKPEEIFLHDRPFQSSVLAFAFGSLVALYLGT
jgi:4-hydroxybenzoate polyprenyltransferase